PAERLLIGQLMDLTDYLSGTESKNWLKLASSVSNAFEQFYRSCRIWGEVKHQTPRLAQARLGLVGVTQVVLRSLLEEQLGVPAPGEL
ncbi:MAG: glutamate acetyltransferase, partial [Moorea sp. SIO4G2]|nr:glutamate acetyltransferase [Moorena sp. SIO4G2]